MQNTLSNTLFYGDNLAILDAHSDDAAVDLVYLDPPFNSNRDYNVLFREQSGKESQSQMKAFGDTWNWARYAIIPKHRFGELTHDGESGDVCGVH